MEFRISSIFVWVIIKSFSELFSTWTWVYIYHLSKLIYECLNYCKVLSIYIIIVPIDLFRFMCRIALNSFENVKQDICLSNKCRALLFQTEFSILIQSSIYSYTGCINLEAIYFLWQMYIHFVPYIKEVVYISLVYSWNSRSTVLSIDEKTIASNFVQGGKT